MPQQHVEAVKRLFAAVRRRDQAGVREAYHPEVVIHESPSLPYGGDYYGHEEALEHLNGYYRTWDPLRPGVGQPGTPIFLETEVSELKTSSGVVVAAVVFLMQAGHLEEERAMNCPHCDSTALAERMKKTALGYRTFHCHPCKRTFNERTGTPFNYLEYPTDLVLLVVLWRLRYTLSLRDLAEMCLARGFEVTHETIRDWEERFAPLMVEQLRAKRKGQAGRSCYVDETYVKVHGRWCSLSRAIDRDGNVVDSMLSETRDRDAAKRFFQRASAVVGHRPDRVTTDGHDSSPRAIREMLGDEVTHRCNRYLNIRLEQDHRGIKQRSYPMRGFGSVASAARFCTAFAEHWRATQPQTVATFEREFEQTIRSSSLEGMTREVVRTTSLLERTNRELRRKFWQVGRFSSPRGVEVAVYIQVTRLNAESGQDELVGCFSLPRT